MTALILALALATQSPAVEQEGAKAVFDRAMARFEVGAFEEALVDFVHAYELTNHHEILFNIAQCHRNLGNLRRAVFFFERYLEHPDAADAEGIRLVVEGLERQLEQVQTASVAAAPPPPPPPPPPPLSETPAVEDASVTVAERWWFWVLIGAGAVAVAGGVWAGVAAGRSDPAEDPIATFDYRGL